MVWRQIAVGVALAAVTVASACHCGGDEQAGVKEAPNGAVEEIEYRALEVEFTGCHATTRVPLTCELKGELTELRFWVAGSRHQPEVAVDGDVLEPVAPIELIDGGHLVIVPVPKAGKELVVTTGPEASPGRWELALLEAPPNPVLDEVMAGLPPEGSDGVREAHTDALATLYQALPNLVGSQKLEVRHKIGLIERTTKSVDERLVAGELLIEDALLAGCYAIATHAARVLAYDLGQAGRFDDAQRLLDLERVYSRQTADAEAASLASYHRGALAARRHDARTVLVELDRARHGFLRLGLKEREQHALALLIPRLGLLGQVAEQRAAVERLLLLIDEGGRSRCDLASHLNNAGWGALLAARSGHSADAARDLLTRALNLSDRANCESETRPGASSLAGEILINAAFLAALEDDATRARALLDRLQTQKLLQHQARWAVYLDALVLEREARDREAAFRVAELTADAASLAGDSFLLWQVQVLHGQLAEKNGQTEEALAAYLTAEDALERLVGEVGLDQGREGLLAGMKSSSSRALALLIKTGDVERAADVAERARTRTHRYVATATPGRALPAASRREWAEHLDRYRRGVDKLEELLAKEQLATRDAAERLQREAKGIRESMLESFRSANAIVQTASPQRWEPGTLSHGELALRFFPVATGWVAFAIDSSGVLAWGVDENSEGEAEAIVLRFLDRFAPQINSAEVLVVQATGAMSSVDLHGLLFNEEPLGFLLPVEYSIGSVRPPEDTRGAGSALVVADPASDRESRLRSALNEGRSVAEALGRLEMNVTLLERSAATRAAVQQRLGSVDLFHYAGHGRVEAGQGWDSRLVLAGSTQFGARDILSLGAAPRIAVLLGCKTGYQGANATKDDMSLAAAFVLSGSERVVASTRDVPDDAALVVAEALYGDEALAVPNVARRLQSATVELAEQGRDAWTAFRVWRP